MNIKIKPKPLLAFVFTALLVGFLSSVAGGTKTGFDNINTPSFVPPAAVFPIVWSILFILMGVSAYIVFEEKDPLSKNALIYYYIQLAVNFLWPVLFFRLHAFLAAFLWLLLLLILVIIMDIKFFEINKLSAYLQIPYILWLIFAGVLNFSVCLLN